MSNVADIVYTICIAYIVSFYVVMQIMHGMNLKRIKNLLFRRVIGICMLVFAPVTLAIWLLIKLLKWLWALACVAAKAIARYTGMDA